MRYTGRTGLRFTGLLTVLPVSLAVALGLPAGPARAQQAPPAPMSLTLEQCLGMGLEKQPALDAARASLASAEDQRQALEKLRLASLLSREICIRKQQADWGVTGASAALEQTRWDTVYAITRNYFSVLYANKQRALVQEAVAKLNQYRKQAQKQVEAKNPDVTTIDVDKLGVNIELATGKLGVASEGLERAAAALREAIGVEACYPLVLVADDLPPAQEGLCRGDLVALALERRGELTQASALAQAAQLEIDAQGTIHGLVGRTFAAGSDIHSKPIPTGVSNKEYRPGAVGPEMPTTLAGHRHDRMARATDLSARAAAVVDKTRNLIVLELDDSYLKWQSSAERVRSLGAARKTSEGVVKRVEERYSAGAASVKEMLEAHVLNLELQAAYNEAVYTQALALAALERITAGGFIPAFRQWPAGHHP